LNFKQFSSKQQPKLSLYFSLSRDSKNIKKQLSFSTDSRILTFFTLGYIEPSKI